MESRNNEAALSKHYASTDGRLWAHNSSPALVRRLRKPRAEKPWTGKLADGREITKQDLSEILKANELWEDSQGKEGQRADLSNANLNGVKLGKVRVNFANLSKISLSNANLSPGFSNGYRPERRQPGAGRSRRNKLLGLRSEWSKLQRCQFERGRNNRSK